MIKNTLVINLFGSPGSGKSTTAADIFTKLKKMSIDCELAPEFAKDLTWEGRGKALTDQLYVMGKQHYRIFRLYGKVKVIITDSPILLSIIYNRNYNNFDALALEAFNKFNNYNIFIPFGLKEYNPNGRNQTFDESQEISDEILKLFGRYNIEHRIFTDVDSIMKDITCRI